MTHEHGDHVDLLRLRGLGVPRRTFPIHEAQLNDRGPESVNGWFAQEADHGYRYLGPLEEA